MPDTTFDTRPATTTKLERPKLYKVILINDDYTPREFVVMVLKAEFKMGESKANAVMLTAHRKGSCVIAVYPRDVAETKADRATDLGRSRGGRMIRFPLDRSGKRITIPRGASREPVFRIAKQTRGNGTRRRRRTAVARHRFVG